MDSPADLTPAPRPARTLDDLEKWLSAPWPGSRQTAWLFVYYLVILVSLLLIYGRGDFETAPFVYQGF